MATKLSNSQSGALIACQRILETLLTKTALPGELVGFDAAARATAARFCAAALATRAESTSVIELETIVASDGKRRMRLVVVNEDMPFLVDSIAGTISSFGLTIERLLHPVAKVIRDDTGHLVSIAEADKSGRAVSESLVYVELDRADARTRATLVRKLHGTLNQVRAAVADWVPMQRAMEIDASRLGDTEDSALLRWFLDYNFTLLGTCVFPRNGNKRGRLGIGRLVGEQLLAPLSRERAFEWFDAGKSRQLTVKSNLISDVHRRVPLDLIIVPIMKDGAVEALSVHTGLWTSAALATAPDTVPILRTHLSAMATKFGFTPVSHTGKALTHALTALPHDLLVGVMPNALEELALTSMSLTDRPRAQLVLIESALKRHLFAFVWLPRDELTTQRRHAIGLMLADAADATILNWSINLGDDGLVLMRFTLDVRGSTAIVDRALLNAQLEFMVRGWSHAVEQQLLHFVDSGLSARLALRFADGFPQAYRSAHTPEAAAQDILALHELLEPTARRVRLVTQDADNASLWLNIYCRDALALSDVVPLLEHFGFRVMEEAQTAVQDGALGYIHSFLVAPSQTLAEGALTKTRAVLERAIADVLEGKAENDPFNALITHAGLAADDVVLFRALFRYLRQTGLSYGLDTVVNALGRAPALARAIASSFRARHDPNQTDGAQALAQAERAITKGLDAVEAIDDDRILRLMRAVVSATLRTNAFSDGGREALALKLDSAHIPGLPSPLPWREIFVYSPRVEGIHLRSGPVARGGLRWSDRRDDFRTEILGLMKAQRVKNAVIVPTGAKGGFYPKMLPPASNREAWLQEGTASYQVFIRALLSITDNIVGEKIVHPDKVVCHDGADPYFVVAADKGTATFSDTANAIAIDRKFWLGDAFASGGSQGYDHKVMAITAKGAWVSVTRHFAELGIDVQRDAIRVAGCGDMSGDVFGNGMLLSRNIRLVAAFDHRHIFIDPSPDGEISWRERSRLFKLPRSSWADYDAKLISRGGGVFSRTEKSIKLTPQMRALLGIDVSALEPAALIAAILKAQVDLLWFGGIGTYVKAAHENQLDAGDRANDALRVNANDLRARVIGEGANLGITQAGRIAFASAGGRINTDFIDNSAGVDCSDHEVNIKIALNTVVASGAMTMDARNTLLTAMTDDVSAHVLEDNRLQTLALSIAEAGGTAALPSYLHLIETFEAKGQLDRAVEGIASNEDVMRRAGDERMLQRPELAVVMSTAKLALQAEIETSMLVSDPGLEDDLLSAFPDKMHMVAGEAIRAHRLRREILATQVANRMVNRMGLVHPFELAEEEGASLADVADAFVVCERLFDAEALWRAIDMAKMDEHARLHLFEQAAIELRAHMADMTRHAVAGRLPSAAAAALAAPVRILEAAIDDLLPAQSRLQTQQFNERLCAMGVPKPLAARVVRLAEMDGVIGLAALSLSTGVDPCALTRAYALLGAELGIDWLQGVAMAMTPSDPWERLLAAGLARDFNAMRLEWLSRTGGDAPESAAALWIAANTARIAQLRVTIDRSRVTGTPSLAMLAQIGGQVRVLLMR